MEKERKSLLTKEVIIMKNEIKNTEIKNELRN